MSAPFGSTPALAIGDVVPAAAPEPRRTFQPVRRSSFHRGHREHTIWRPLGKTKAEAWDFHDAVLKAARYFDDDRKMPGDRIGPIGLTGRKVLEVMLEIADKMSGRLEPAIATIAAKAKLAIGTVVRALGRLREHGFLDWIRRTEPLDNDGAGPQVRQITNAYGFRLRGAAAALVARLRRRPLAPPDDDVQRRQADAEEAEAMLNALPLAEQAHALVEHPELAEALANVGRALERSAISTMGENPDPKVKE